MEKITTQSVEQTHDLAKSLLDGISEENRIICLSGDLGSGKTTFAQGFLGACGAEKPYTSPTFTIMKEYDIDVQGFSRVYHIDAYRITGSDMVELGWSDIIAEKTALVIIEWPEKIQDILPENIQMIECSWISDNERQYFFNK